MTDEELYKKAEKFLKNGKINEAENALLNVNEKTATYYYLHSEIDYLKGWTNECRKNLEKALELDPENKKYKDVYDKLVKRAEPVDMSEDSFENPYGRERQMGKGACTDGCAEACAECGCMLCLEGICQGICDGI